MSGWGGLFLATQFNLPAGASIVIVSTVIFIFSVLFSPKKVVKNDN
ncbi:MAG: metal ABC transporter permease [Candidatus Ratteibacteria bacterium]|nr:metal ABC transporter permease [Candidatus Ratteibacteria bacterium]